MPREKLVESAAFGHAGADPAGPTVVVPGHISVHNDHAVEFLSRSGQLGGSFGSQLVLAPLNPSAASSGWCALMKISGPSTSAPSIEPAAKPLPRG
eukprot:3632101-Alexandrium_andersonii.AAC.1